MKTIKQLKVVFSILVLTGTLLFSTGCWIIVVGAAAGAGAATVAYVDGNLVVTYANSYDSVVAAANSAVTDLGFAKPEERKDQLSDTLNTHSMTGDSVKIVITKTSDAVTKVDIRVGTFGDEQLSRSINDKIKAHLP